jgi:hypothetical protein
MYESAIKSIFELIDESTFSLPVIPRSFSGAIDTGGDEFLAVQVMIPDSSKFYNKKLIMGYLYIDIFTKVGEDLFKTSTILDELDSVFQGKILENGLQFEESRYQDLGKDSDNPSLTRIEYQIPFKLYGEL